MPFLKHNMYTLPQDNLFGQFPRNSIIGAHPEINVGRVDSGRMVKSIGGGDLLEKKKSG